MTADSLMASPFAQSAMAYAAKASAAFKLVPVKRWRQLLMVLIAIWLVHSLARLFWVLIPVPNQPVTPVVPIAQGAADVSTAVASVDLKSVNDLFGLYDPRAREKELEEQRKREAELAAAEPVKETKLNLKLQGVIASNEPSKSWAIIGETNSQKLYKIGDKIPGARNVSLKDVADLWVILDNSGKPEKLWLYGEDGKKVAVSRTAPRPVRSQPKRTQPANVTKREISSDQIAQAKSIGDVVRFMVATENGQMVGYKVRPGRKRELFDQVGLKNNDIVVSVNGIEVNEPQKVREVYQALKTATEANLEVMRDGSTQFIEIRMSSE